MLSGFFPSLIAGCLLGVLSGLGVGGGSLLILWLTVVLGMAQNEAQLLNLLFFLPCALCASIFHLRQGKLPLRPAAFAIAAGLSGAALSSQWSQQLAGPGLKKAFGILFILCGLRELFYRPREFK